MSNTTPKMIPLDTLEKLVHLMYPLEVVAAIEALEFSGSHDPNWPVLLARRLLEEYKGN